MTREKIKDCIDYTLLLFSVNAINKVSRKNNPEITMISPVEEIKILIRKKSKIENKKSENPAVLIKKVLRFISVVIAKASDKQREKFRNTLMPKIILNSSTPEKILGMRINP
jgi:hypothetical protein